MILSLAKMKKGQSGTVVELRGGREVRSRLRAMGIIKGVEITQS